MLRLPSTAAIIGLGLVGLLVLIVAAKGLSDPDLFWHLKAGELIVSSRSVPNVDPFSFTWYGQPWTPHEWLSEVLIYLLAGGVGVAFGLLVFGLLAGLILFVLVVELGRRQVRPAAIALAAALSGWALIPYVTIRPQVLSWLLMAILVVFLWRLDADRPKRVLWLIPLFALWANLHGLWVVGLGVLVVYGLFTLAGRTPMAPAQARNWLIVAGFGCGLAVMLTPAGPAGILYPLRYIDAGDWGLEHILEWQSPDFHNPANWGQLALILVLTAVSVRRVPGWLAVLAWLGVVMSLVSLRNTPLLAVWALPVIAVALNERFPLTVAEPMSSRRARTRRLMELATAVVVLVGGTLVIVPSASVFDVEGKLARKFPVAALDRLAQLQPDANLLVEYGWGGYAIYRIFDAGGRVFVDGRNDMYDQSILEDYTAIREAEPGWQQLLADYQVEAMLWPPSVVLTRGPAAAAGWCEMYRDDRQVLYVRDCPPD